MKRSTFQHWVGRIGIAAALLLVLVPTAGRVIHASAAVAGTHAAHQGYAHARHAGHGAGHGRQDGDSRPAIGDPDCDYCPLLTSMVAVPGIAFDVVQVPPATATAVGPRMPRLRWLHPCGLGSRGPPLRG